MDPRLIIIFSAFFFGLMGFLTKIATFTIPGSQAILFRSLLASGLLLVPVALRFTSFRLVNLQLLALRGLFGGAAVTFYFLSLQYIPLGAAIVLNHTSIIFATLYEGLFYREKFNVYTVLALFASFAGVLLIFFPELDNLNVGYLFGLLCGSLGGGAIVSIRHLRQTEASWIIVWFFSLAGILFSLPLALTALQQRTPVTYSSMEWMLLLGLTLSGLAAQLLFTYACKFVRGSEAGTMGILTIVIATTFGIVFLGEVLTLPFVMGASLIVGSSLYLARLLPFFAPPIEPQ